MSDVESPSIGLPLDILCEFCENIFKRAWTGFPTDADEHHPSIESLHNSVDLGCVLCTKVLDVLEIKNAQNPNNGALGDTLSRASFSYQRAYLEDTLEDSFNDATFEPLRCHCVTFLINGADKTNGKDFVLEETDLQFNIWPMEDCEAFIPRAQLPADISEESSWKIARGWLDECQKTHDCYSAKEWFPTRLLDLGLSSSRIQIIETAEHQLHGEYFTLSHRWGNANFLTLVDGNSERLHSGFSISELPKTFQDAVAITRKLQVRYLWIDSLCIIQGDTKDWEREAPKMYEVYGNSACNLAATGAGDNSKGLFRSRDPSRIQPRRVSLGWPDEEYIPPEDEVAADIWLPGSVREGDYLVMESDLWLSDVTNEALNKRAWVLQERLLSPRILHFGRKQLFWECSGLEACELYPDGVPSEFQNSDMTRDFKKKFMTPSNFDNEDEGADESADEDEDGDEDEFELANEGDLDCNYREVLGPSGVGFVRFIGIDHVEYNEAPEMGEYYRPVVSQREIVWSLVISHYTKCAITKVEDRLPALSGLAHEICRLHGGEYLAGLWRESLVQGLLWEVAEDCTSSHRQREYRAPTWSWASLEGAVSLPVLEEEYVICTIQEANVQLRTDDEFGNVTSGMIRISAKLHRLDYRRDSRCISWTGWSLKGNEENEWIVHSKRNFFNRSHHFSLNFDENITKIEGTAYCLVLVAKRGSPTLIGGDFQLQGLLVVPTGNNPGEYLRVGTFSTRGLGFIYHVAESPHSYPCLSYNEELESHIIDII